ncbi:hypothetical protein Tco_1038399 [Tanacetum coccineum]
MPPKRTSTSAAPAMTQAAIKKLVADSVSAARSTSLLLGQILKILIEHQEKRSSGEYLKTYVEKIPELAYAFGVPLCAQHRETHRSLHRGLPRSMKEMFTAQKPHTLEETINIT